MPPASDTEREIHVLILHKDDLAFAKLCDIYFEPVYKKVRAFNRGIADDDETLVMDVVTDSFMNYFKNPQRYDPNKLSLEKFLIMDSEGDLKNAWQKLKRTEKKFEKSVEHDTISGNRVIEDPDLNPLDRLIEGETKVVLEKGLTDLFDTDKDLQLAHLLLSGERRSSEYAKILEIEAWESHAQQLEIKRQKDRIDKTIRRKFKGNL